MQKNCYACGQKASSEEHVPPLRLFPAQKDLPSGMSCRINLIKVPSCDNHNLRKSKDDEYLMMILTVHFLNNSTAAHHFSTKIMRAWRRRPHLAAMALKELRPAVLNGEETATFTVNLERYNRSMNLIVKGLFFHHTASVLPHDFKIWSTTLLPSSGAMASSILDTSKFISSEIAQLFKDQPLLGSNPSVFMYQLHVPQSSENIACARLIFYEGIEVISLSTR
jgi:hypothetical protein